MHKYLMEIERYFIGKEHFIVLAENKKDAVQKATIPPDCKADTLKCIKKLQS